MFAYEYQFVIVDCIIKTKKIMAATAVSKRITYQEFQQMEIQEDDQHIYELLNGEIVKYSAPESKHQIISANLHLLIGPYVKQKN